MSDDSTVPTALPRPHAIFPTYHRETLNRLATSADIIRLQNEANARAAAAFERSSWRGLTIRRALADAGEALFGTMSDVMRRPTGKLPSNLEEALAWEPGSLDPLDPSVVDAPVPLWTLATKNDRLRGFGVLLVLLAAIGLFLSM